MTEAPLSLLPDIHSYLGEGFVQALEVRQGILEGGGIEFEMVLESDWSTVLSRGKVGKVDGFASLAKTSEREHYLSFSEPYISFPIKLFTKSRYGYIGDLSELNGKKVLLVSGGSVLGEVYGLFWVWDRLKVFKEIPVINTIRIPDLEIRYTAG